EPPGAGIAMMEESLAQMKRIGDPWGTGYMLNCLGVSDYRRGETERARAHWEEAVQRLRGVGDRRYCHSLANLGWVHHTDGRFSRARALYEESLAVVRSLGDHWYLPHVLFRLGMVLTELGAMDEAVSTWEELLSCSLDAADLGFAARALWFLGHIAVLRGE